MALAPLCQLARIHSLAMSAGLAVLVLAAIGFGPLDLGSAPVLAGATILMLGVPHGACDVEILKNRWQITDAGGLRRALVAYIAAGVCVLALRWAAPTAFLVFFLAIAAYHFAGDWPEISASAARMCVGGALLTATTLLHRQQVGDIFALIIPGNDGALIAAVMQALALPLFAATAWAAARVRSPFEVVEYGLALMAATVLPPLTFFVVYFCGLHSVRHLFAVRAELRAQSLLELSGNAAPYAVVAVLGTLAGAALVGAGRIDHDLIGAIFVALAALTVPHMLLVDAG